MVKENNSRTKNENSEIYDDKYKDLIIRLGELRVKFGDDVRSQAMSYKELVSDKKFTELFNGLVIDLVRDFVGVERRTEELESLVSISVALDKIGL